jgi:predicted alpha/beta superfamily hydrolase
MSKISITSYIRFFKIVVIFFTITIQTASVSGQQFRYTQNNPVIKTYTISSKILNEERKISIYTPELFPEYANAVAPVIYVLDGDAYMNYVSSLINIYCERYVQLPPIKVVSVENFIKDNFNSRDRDFTNGEDNFVRFVKEEVIPLAENDYKRTPYRVLVGHSLSGGFVIGAFFKYPALFNAYLACSPGGNLNDAVYLKTIDSTITNSSERNNTLFLSVGNEQWAQRNIKNVDTLLRNKKFKGFSYRIIFYPNEEHFSVFLKAYYDGLRYIFMIDPADGLKDPRDMTPRIFKNHYETLSKTFGFSMKPPEVITGYYADAFLNNWNDLDKALEFFKMNTENCPENGWLHFLYAEALLKKGDKKNAMTSYEKSLQLDPSNTNARATLNKLKNEQNTKKE